MKDTWSVYIHTNIINNKKYVGISRQPQRRWKNGKGYKSQLFGRAIQKYGWENFTHEILYKGLTESEACDKEAELISIYNTTDDRYGYNILDKGNISDSDAQHRNAKRVYQYSLDGDYIASYNSIAETSRLVGDGVSGCINGHARTAYNYQWFDEYKGKKVPPILSRNDAISVSQYKKVFQYTLDGKFINEFDSIKEAAETNGIERTGIHNCITHKQLSHKGYRWFEEYMGESIEPINKYPNSSKTVYQYTLDGVYVNCYNSQRAASRAVGKTIRITDDNNVFAGYKWYFSPIERKIIEGDYGEEKAQ